MGIEGLRAPWPEGTTARYLTSGFGFVDVTKAAFGFYAGCSGCIEWCTYVSPVSIADPLKEARDRAQVHAEKCRAVPNPEGVTS